MRIDYLMFRFCAAWAEYKRMLQAKKVAASRHVPTHTSYWVCLPAGAFMIFNWLNSSFLGQIWSISFCYFVPGLVVWQNSEMIFLYETRLGLVKGQAIIIACKHVCELQQWFLWWKQKQSKRLDWNYNSLFVLFCFVQSFKFLNCLSGNTKLNMWFTSASWSW